MVDSSSAFTSVAALIIVAIRSVKSLHRTVSRFEGQDKTLQRLQDELQGTISVLNSSMEVAHAEASISTLLQGPIDWCSNVCQEFEMSINAFSQKNTAGFRNWAKLEFMEGNMNEFIDTISVYKCSIAVGLGIITICATRVSQQELNGYDEMLQDTVYNLNLRLQRVDEKLKSYPNSKLSTPRISLDDEREAIQMCFWICKEAKKFLESFALETTMLQDGQNATENDEQDKRPESFASDIRQLENDEQSLLLNYNSKNCKEGLHLLEVCKVAGDASAQAGLVRGVIIADRQSSQAVINASAGLFQVKTAICRDRSTQLLGSMPGEDLQSFAERHYGS